MALINCPECNSQISDKANSCPNCGYPLPNNVNQSKNDIDQSNQNSLKEKDETVIDKLNFLGLEGCSGCLIYFVLAFIVLGMIGNLIPESNDSDFSDNSNHQQDNPSRTMSKIMCEDFVEKRLKAPSTAEFASLSETNIRSQNKNVFIVSSHVDAENPMGAKLRNDYTCKIKYRGDDQWRLIDLQIK